LYNIVNVKESLVIFKFVVLNGCWGRRWSETVNDFWGFPNQLHEIRNIFVSVCYFPREVLPDVLTDPKLLPQCGFFGLCSFYFDNGIQVVKGSVG